MKNLIFKKLNKNIFRKNIIAIDTEDDSKGNLVSICVYDGKKYYIFKNNVDFIEFLNSYNFSGKLYIACTNLEYDIVNLFNNFYNLVDFFYGQRLIFCKYKKRNIYFFDTLNHYFISVKEQGKYLGLKKLKMDINNIEYTKRDTLITYTFVNKYQDFLNQLGGELKFTIASSCMDLFRRKYFDREYKKIPNRILNFLRNSYYGGRTEIFKMKSKSDGENKIYYYDINSLYPYCMMSNNLPVPDSYYITNDIKEYGVAYCEIEYLDKDYIPYLPYRYKGKLFFPVGKLKGYWTHFELRYGLENKIIKINKIYDSIAYKEGYNYFYSYVNNLYLLRKKYKDDKFKNFCLKILMNSLYGKFAEKVKNVKLAVNNLGQITEIVKGKEYYPIHTNYIISIYITAIARTILYEGLKRIYNTNNELLYCDTDSIIYKGKKGILPEGTDIGQYKLENEFKEAYFYQPKTYYLIDFNNEKYLRTKGVKKEYSFDFLVDRICYIKRPVKLREHLKRTDKDYYKPNVWLEFEKKLRTDYNKRIICKDGINTCPVCLYV